MAIGPGIGHVQGTAHKCQSDLYDYLCVVAICRIRLSNRIHLRGLRLKLTLTAVFFALDHLLASDASVGNLCIDTLSSEVREHPPATQRCGMPLLDGYSCFRTAVAFNAHCSCQLWYIIYIYMQEDTMMSQLKMANFRDEFTRSELFSAQRSNTHNFQCNFV